MQLSRDLVEELFRRAPEDLRKALLHSNAAPLCLTASLCEETQDVSFAAE